MADNQALLQIVNNEPSFCFGTASTRLAVTRTAGMMGPVTFFADSPAPVEPYYMNPWWNEGVDASQPTLLGVLRGDFFCAPFGGNGEPFDGTVYPPHGEPANMPWQLDEHRATSAGAAIQMSQGQTLRAGQVRKQIAVLEGQSVVYSRHDLAGMSGPTTLGHHANLFLPDGVEPAYLSFAPHRYAHTYVEPTERPEGRGYSIIKPDAQIEDLTRCPLINGETTDLTRYPTRRGFEDIVIICSDQARDFGWSAFSVPALGYVWFALKDPKALASTLLWMSNGGRHFPPWNGRNVNTIGIEEITGFFHEGIAPSARENFLEKMGVPTHVELSPERPTTVNYIQGVARLPQGFTRVASIEASGETGVRLTSEEGLSIEVALEISFITKGILKDLIR